MGHGLLFPYWDRHVPHPGLPCASHWVETTSFNSLSLRQVLPLSPSCSGGSPWGGRARVRSAWTQLHPYPHSPPAQSRKAWPRPLMLLRVCVNALVCPWQWPSDQCHVGRCSMHSLNIPHPALELKWEYGSVPGVRPLPPHSAHRPELPTPKRAPSPGWG